jgi:hypothetical protein
MLHEDYYYKSSVGENPLVVGLRGPGDEMNWLTVNRQSYNKFDLEYENQKNGNRTSYSGAQQREWE